MTREEFLNLTGIEDTDLSEEDFSIINYVYMFHPAIPCSCGKEMVSHIYLVGGMACIRGMLEAAKYAEQISKSLVHLNNQKRKLCDRMEHLKKGDTVYEHCIDDLKVCHSEQEAQSLAGKYPMSILESDIVGSVTNMVYVLTELYVDPERTEKNILGIFFNKKDALEQMDCFVKKDRFGFFSEFGIEPINRTDLYCSSGLEENEGQYVAYEITKMEIS